MKTNKDPKWLDKLVRYFTPEMKETAKEITAKKGVLETTDVLEILCKNPEAGRKVIDEANCCRHRSKDNSYRP